MVVVVVVVIVTVSNKICLSIDGGWLPGGSCRREWGRRVNDVEVSEGQSGGD